MAHALLGQAPVDTGSGMISRRDILRALGLTGLALPLAGRLHAQTSPPLRLILWPMMNGVVIDYFFPQNLSALTVVTEPLAPYRDQLTFVRQMGIDGSRDHYAIRSIYSGAPIADYNQPDPQVKSLDQLVADKIQAAAPTRLRSLHLGVIPADNISLYKQYGRSTLFFGPGGALDYEANPVTAFDRLFGSASSTSPGAPAESAAELEGAVLDITEAELREVAARVGDLPTESSKISVHLSALRALRSRLQSAPASTRCDSSPMPTVEKLRPMLQNNPAAAYNYALFSDLFDAQIDILARALTCGLTRVATLQAASADGPQTVPVGPGYAHHPTSHGDPATFAQCQRWYMGKLKRLLDALNVPDPLDGSGKTVLYNTAIVVLAECVPNGHGSDHVPCLLLGRGGGLLKGGAIVNVPGGTNKNLLKAIASRVFGVPDAASAHFGNTPMTEVLA